MREEFGLLPILSPWFIYFTSSHLLKVFLKQQLFYGFYKAVVNSCLVINAGSKNRQLKDLGENSSLSPAEIVLPRMP